MELSLEIKNAQLTLAAIREECMAEGACLAVLYEKRNEVRKEMAAAHESFSLEKELIAEERQKLVEETLVIQQKRKDLESFEILKKKEIEIAEQQVHDAMKELSKLNSWVATAEDRETELKETLRAVESQIEAKYVMLKDVEDIKKEHEEAKDNLLGSQVDWATEGLAADEKIALAKKELVDIQLEKDVALAAVSDAEEQRHSILDEKARIANDLEIYIKRIEEKYGEAFPELRMKL